MTPASIRSISLAAAAALSLAGAAWAHDGATGVVKARMDGMKEMSNATKALGAVKLGAIPYDPAVIRRAAAALRANGEAAKTQFPEGSDGAPSEALPAVWSDREKFDRLLDDLVAASFALDAAADDRERAMWAADAVAAACKSCHQDFRAKKL